MAYNFQKALDSGLSPQEITNYLASKGRQKEAESFFGTVQKKPSYLQRVGEAFKSGVSKVKSGIDQAGDAKNPLQLFEGSLKIGAGAVDTAFSPLSAAVEPVVKPTIGKAIEKVTDKISDSPAVQKFADSKAGDVTSRVAEDVGNLNTIASAVAGSRVAKATPSAVAETARVGVELGSKATSTAVKTGKDIISKSTSKIGNKITPMEKGVETVLKNKSIPKSVRRAKLTRYADQAERAVNDYSQPTPLELAGNEAGKALEKINTTLKKAGLNKSKILEANSKKPVGTIVQDSLREYNDLVSKRLGVKFDSKGELLRVKGRASTVSDPSDLKLLKAVHSKVKSLDGKFPTVKQLDDTIDYLQDLLYKKSSDLTIPVNSQVEAVVKGITNKINSHIQTLVGKNYIKANAEYARIRVMRDTLNKALGVEGNKGASLMKQLFSPSGTASRKLFAQIKKETGIDLVEDATLAKFVMENIGDVRQASLLEQIIRGQVSPTKAGVLNYAIDKTVGKLQDPIKKAKDIIDNGD